MTRDLYWPISILIVVLGCAALGISAQPTAFNYQGNLTDGGSPANGAYQMQFRLFDTVSGGSQIGSTLADIPITAANGSFSVKLDFGTNALSGQNRWLEIAVRQNSGQSYTTLSPREQIASSPYSVRTLSAAMADDSQKLGGVAANQFVQTSDPRLTDAREPLPNNANYIQNRTTQQALSNFNISGNGQFGGNVAIGGGISQAYKLSVESSTSAGIAASTTILNGSGILASASGPNGIGVYSFGPPSSAGGGYAGFFEGRGYFSGNVGIGATSPNTRLTVAGGVLWTSNAWTASMNLNNASAIGWEANASGQRFGIGQSGGGLYFFRTNSAFGNGASPANYDLIISDSGSVGIGTNPSGLFRLESVGNVYLNGFVRVGSFAINGTNSVCRNLANDLASCSSSLKYKTNIGEFTSGMAFVNKLRPITFEWKEGGMKDVGFGAEDLEKIDPLFVTYNGQNRVEGVKYDRLSVVLVNAIKEQQQTIERLQLQIDVLTRLVCQSNRQATVCKEKE